MQVEFVKSAVRSEHFPPADRPEVAFAGRSNVGKSSLINILVNRRSLARTSASPGRTQAINFFRVGDDLYLVDLPGYGFARVPLALKQSWQCMVENYLGGRPNLKCVVVILDIRREVSAGDQALFGWLAHYGIQTLPVITKTDKLSRNQALAQARLIARTLGGFTPRAPLLFSARTRQGRDEVWQAIRDLTRSP